MIERIPPPDKNKNIGKIEIKNIKNQGADKSINKKRPETNAGKPRHIRTPGPDIADKTGGKNGQIAVFFVPFRQFPMNFDDPTALTDSLADRRIPPAAQAIGNYWTGNMAAGCNRQNQPVMIFADIYQFLPD